MHDPVRAPRRDRFDPAAYDLDAIEAERDALRRELGAERWDRVSAAEREWEDWNLSHIVETLTTHLPGLAPAIRALVTHATDDDPPNGCCGLPPLGERARPA